MTICYFGDINCNPDFTPNKVLTKGFFDNSVTVTDLRVNTKHRFKKYWNAFWNYKTSHTKFDLVLIPFTNSRWMPLVARLATRQPIIWYAFLSKYDIRVFDKKITKKYSLKGFYQYFAEWLACRLATKILLDTNEHIKYLAQLFHVSQKKFIKVLISTDDSVFYPQTESTTSDKFLVSYHGNFIPVQGVEYIIQAAHILKDHSDIEFQMIGTGQKYNDMVQLAQDLNLKNVHFLRRIDFDKMPVVLSQADVLLGNFGATDKTLRVIATKSYEAIALKKAQISADVPAMRELFTDRINILFCERANAQDLADKILELKNNETLKNKIATGGYQLFKTHATPQVIVKQLLQNLQSLHK